jgi:hypothetical protein
VLEEIERSGDLEHAVEDSVRQAWSPVVTAILAASAASLNPPPGPPRAARPSTDRTSSGGGNSTQFTRAFPPHAATMAAR